MRGIWRGFQEGGKLLSGPQPLSKGKGSVKSSKRRTSKTEVDRIWVYSSLKLFHEAPIPGLGRARY